MSREYRSTELMTLIESELLISGRSLFRRGLQRRRRIEGEERRHKRPASELCIMSKTVKSFILTTGKQHESRRDFVPQRENSQQFVLSINGESLSFPFPLSTPKGQGFLHTSVPPTLEDF